MVREVSPADYLRERGERDDLQLIDVREAWELEIAALPGAVHVPMAEVTARLAELDPAREIVVLCRSGGRSLAVARLLEARGYPRVANLSGGILAWARDVDPSLATY